MNEPCIYCSKSFDPTKGQGDHIIPAQLGEFRDDVRFRGICRECNTHMGDQSSNSSNVDPNGFIATLSSLPNRDAVNEAARTLVVRWECRAPKPS